MLLLGKFRDWWHPDIDVKSECHFKDDGVHLFKRGNDLFLNRLSAGPEAIICRDKSNCSIKEIRFRPGHDLLFD